MAYTHVAHDCHLGNDVILSNAVNMAGHVHIEDHAIVGGLTAIHQFARIGAHAFVGGASRISQDVAPYCLVAGSPAKLYGLNSVGLGRRGFSAEARQALKQAYQILFNSDLNLSQAVARAREEAPQVAEVVGLLDFIEGSERGITT
jgi:UDP-N-acetylglucosamine acyltransferase